MLEIKGEIQLDDIRGEVKEVVAEWRRKEYVAKREKEAQRRPNQLLLDLPPPNLSPYTPPQIDIYKTGIDNPEWL